ncbi:MAG: efflux RND transporter periplasmic adaptor subunit [Chitinophagales bacterium]|nr:efflux RND transporter periplasmic adaptor subunit [Chitinophagales bacterium]
MNVLRIIFTATLLFTLVSCKETKEEKLQKTLEKLRAEQHKLEEQKRLVDQLKEEVLKLDGKNVTTDELYTLITTLHPQVKNFQQFIEFQGKVVADKSVMVSPETGGLATQVNIEEGQYVQKGQAIAYLDNQMLKDNITELRSSLELAKEVYERQKNLWDQKIGTEVQYLQAKTNKESLEKKLITLQNQVGKSVVYAPISGVVDMVFVKTGEMAAPGMPIAKVTNLSTIKVEADISEVYAGKFRRGEQILVRFPSIDRQQTATITNITQFINPGNRTFKVQAEIANTGDHLMVPNMVAVVALKDKQNDHAIVIPTRLIQQSAEGEYVMITGKNTAQKVLVTTGATFNGETEIISGLQPTDVLIDGGFRDVIEGDKIKIQK